MLGFAPSGGGVVAFVTVAFEFLTTSPTVGGDPEGRLTVGCVVDSSI